MAGDAVPSAAGEDQSKVEAAAEHTKDGGVVGTKKKRRGFLRRMWMGIFGRGGEDYEKRLRYLSKEEAAVHARMKRRAQRSRRTFRNIIVFSVALEVAAVAYAITTTRSIDLNWQMRALRVLPMFLLPLLSAMLYKTTEVLTKMFDQKDQKTLEKLRAERKAKIDELKERTNYYTTQQLIQRYDLDPAAKAAAATVLASKLGADSGLNFNFGDESNNNVLSGKSNDVEPVQAAGLRNRKQSHSRSHSTGRTGSISMAQVTDEISNEYGLDNQEGQTPQFVPHYKGPTPNDGGWLARIAALLVGEDPTQCYALICGNCRMHNGLARKEDFPYITYYCPHCHALNGSQQPDGHESGLSSGRATPLAPGDSSNANNASAMPMAGGGNNLPTVEELPVAARDEKGEGDQQAS